MAAAGCAPARDRLLESRFDHVAVSVLRQDRGEGSLAGPRRIFNDAIDVRLGKKAQEIDAASGDARVGRERNHRDAAIARGLCGGRHRLGEQRPENDFSTLIDGLLRTLLCALRSAAVVLDQELDIRILKFGERQFCGVAHRLRGDGGIAGRRQRQQEPDLDLAAAHRRWLLLRAGRLLATGERRLHAGATGNERRPQNQADSTAAGRAGAWRLWSERRNHH